MSGAQSSAIFPKIFLLTGTFLVKVSSSPSFLRISLIVSKILDISSL